MPTPVLLVSVEKVARRLGIPTPPPLKADVIEVITDSILAAQAKVAAYLNRPIFPTASVVMAAKPNTDFALSDVRAWPTVVFADSPVVVVSSVVSVTDPGTYDVTFSVGLDPATDQSLAAILTFIRQDAVADLLDSPALTQVKQRVKSVSAEGQSVSYESYGRKSASPDAAGGDLTVTTLRYWRRYGVGRGIDPDLRPFPYRGI